VHLVGSYYTDQNSVLSPAIYILSNSLFTKQQGALHDQTTHRQVHRTHIQTEGIRPQTQKRQIAKRAAEKW
jgi:hypothetical protein